MTSPTKTESELVDRLLKKYASELDKIALFRDQLFTALSDSPELSRHVHSMKTRLKDPDHLREKLFRKLAESKKKGKAFAISPANLLTSINDLAGIRVLHLYTRQIRDIDAALRLIFKEQRYSLREKPFAHTWDDESRDFFRSCGIKTQQSPTLYTSVHYVVGSASRTIVTCEIQVRTLMEEVWGEVDHSMNYPSPVEILACEEQLKVLARITSGATRLVDSIFLTLEDSKSVEKPKPVKSVRRRPTKRTTRRKQE